MECGGAAVFYKGVEEKGPAWSLGATHQKENIS